MWNNTDTPLAYFISFRTYGTWLHGDKRGSIDRHHNQYGSPYIPPNDKWHQYNQRQLKTKPLIVITINMDRRTFHQMISGTSTIKGNSKLSPCSLVKGGAFVAT
jgi:hypothetical protein